MRGVGGLPERRPDQRFSPPPQVLQPGSSAGIFRGFQVVVSGTGAGRGVFVYSPSFALGNLIGSIGPGGTGPLGESYPAGITWGLATSVQVQLTTGTFPAGSGVIEFINNLVAGLAQQAAYFGGTVLNSHGNTVAKNDYVGPGLAAAGHRDLLFWRLSASDGTNSAEGFLNYQDDTGAVNNALGLSDAGLNMTGVLFGVWPGTGTSPVNPFVAETWHNMAGSYTNSWTDAGGGNVVGRYRKVGSPPNTVEVEGVIQHAAIAGASNFFTLPAGWAPAGNIPVCQAGTLAGATFGSSLIMCNAGVLQANGMAAGTANVFFHGFISLD